ncbi:hypothetical protein WEI85_01380 [Actinomycetes bacterium KLBMP 9797]
MSLARYIVLPIGATIALILVATPATAAPAVTVYEGAHAGFESPDGRQMTVDLNRVNGQATLDVEWSTHSCDAEQAPRTCSWVSRTAYDVEPASSRLSLRRAAVTADLVYDESRRTCTYTPAEEGEEETCAEVVRSVGAARIELAWTARGDVTQESYEDSEGRLHLTWRTGAEASGTAFGERYPVEQSLITQLSRTLVYESA